MKSNIEKVYSKLPQKKHNFRKHNIELGLVQDLEDRVYNIVPKYEELKKTNEKKVDFYNEYSNLKDKVDSLAEEIKEEKNEILSQLDEAKSKANELGIELDAGTLIEKELDQLDVFLQFLNNSQI
jgi:pyridoxine 5'-phosphate synthase PdxJ